MQFLDLKVQYRPIKKEINQAIKKVLDRGVFIGGEEVEKFEKEVAEFCKAKYGIGVNSGTDALYLSLKALGIGPGDEVITTPFTFIATAEAIANCGAKPVFVDINPDTFNIDNSKIDQKISKKTKAIIPVHLFGKKAEIDSRGLYIIEDSAQAIGLALSGDTACFSFFPSKNLGGCGDGGIIVSNNPDLIKGAKLLRNHGADSRNKYCNLILGTNSRLDAIQAAILRVKLKHVLEWNKKRTQAAQYYNNSLKQVVTVPENNNIFHQYTIRAEKRDQLKEYLEKNNIPTMIYYPLPLHLQPVFKYLEYKKGDFPEAERGAKEVLSLPIYPEMTRENQGFVIDKIKDFFKR